MYKVKAEFGDPGEISSSSCTCESHCCCSCHVHLLARIVQHGMEMHRASRRNEFDEIIRTYIHTHMANIPTYINTYMAIDPDANSSL
jgi:hypothetical protein